MKMPTQSTTTAGTAGNPALPPATNPSGNGIQPGAPTVVNVPNYSADLRVIVTKNPNDAQPGSPATYSVDVKNVGNTDDPGPIQVTFKVPPGSVIEAVTPGPGWTCVEQERVVYCTRPEPLPAGQTTRAVDITVRNPDAPTAENEVTARVISDGAVDPNPADNLWGEFGGNRRIAGGGIGCSLSPGHSSAGFGALAAFALALLCALRRRSYRASEHTN